MKTRARVARVEFEECFARGGPRQFACEFLHRAPPVRFGRRGGLVEIRYGGFGFVHTRKTVFTTIHHRLGLPICNRRFPTPLVPFFEPMVVGDPDGPWSVSEDYAFCERARRVLTWPLLKPGGLLGFDDYQWRVFPEPERCPGLAVDAFLVCMRGQFEEVHRGYQVWVRKTR